MSLKNLFDELKNINVYLNIEYSYCHTNSIVDLTLKKNIKSFKGYVAYIQCLSDINSTMESVLDEGSSEVIYEYIIIPPNFKEENFQKLLYFYFNKHNIHIKFLPNSVVNNKKIRKFQVIVTENDLSIEFKNLWKKLEKYNNFYDTDSDHNEIEYDCIEHEHTELVDNDDINVETADHTELVDSDGINVDTVENTGHDNDCNATEKQGINNDNIAYDDTDSEHTEHGSDVIECDDDTDNDHTEHGSDVIECDDNTVEHDGDTVEHDDTLENDDIKNNDIDTVKHDTTENDVDSSDVSSDYSSDESENSESEDSGDSEYTNDS